MQKAVGLSPIIVLLAVLIGAKLYGIPGALLAVPLAASISVIIHEWQSISGMLKRKES
jgi:predicted PurR-regulated permease PerM